jgi:hypothetical protein
MRKTYGVSLNDADDLDAWLMELLNNERSVSDIFRQALVQYYTETPQTQSTDNATQAIVEAIDRQGDKLIAALGALQITAAPGETRGNGHLEKIDPAEQLTKNLLGAADEYRN